MMRRERIPLPPKKKRNNEEQTEQIKFATWLDKRGVRFYHVPNGGNRNMFEAIKFKRMGTKRGVPDICIPVARCGRHGLYIEMKSKVGVLSDEQKEWGIFLINEGYGFEVAKGFEHAKEIVEGYFSTT
jgi:hypothetical protein